MYKSGIQLNGYGLEINMCTFNTILVIYMLKFSMVSILAVLYCI